MHSVNCVLVAVDVRSAHNVGSFFRTCDGLGIERLYLTGITPYPAGLPDETRLPHVAQKTTKDIRKTALGAEESLNWTYHPDTAHILSTLKEDGWYIVGLEQVPDAKDLTTIEKPKKVALVVGNEITGLMPEILQLCNEVAEIKMLGNKESLNVSVAAAIGLFWLKNG